MLLALLVMAVVAAVLAAPLVARSVKVRHAARRQRLIEAEAAAPLYAGYDPGRERRAEQRARQLLRSCVNDEEWGMYRDLGFIRVNGRLSRKGRGSGPEAQQRRADEATPHEAPYAYLIYPHKPIVAYVPKTSRLLSEYCVEFPDLTGAISQTRLPDSDDVLAKWMALTGDEERLIRNANMHLPGRQVDPGRVRRDLWRLSEWERQRRGYGPVRAPRT
jgi:hypothetical protein